MFRRATSHLSHYVHEIATRIPKNMGSCRSAHNHLVPMMAGQTVRRGRKTVSRFLPNAAADLEPVLALLEHLHERQVHRRTKQLHARFATHSVRFVTDQAGSSWGFGALRINLSFPSCMIVSTRGICKRRSTIAMPRSWLVPTMLALSCMSFDPTIVTLHHLLECFKAR